MPVYGRQQSIQLESGKAPSMGQLAPEAPAIAAMEQTQPCLTCARERPRAEFGAAALWPDVLGGAAAPAPFQAGGMCRACRDHASTQVDMPFLTGWSMQAELARAAHLFLDPQRPGPAPMTYLGIASGIPVAEGEICDRWAGLAGEAVYHVHPQRRELFAGHGSMELPAGVDDGGHATLVLTSPSQFWSAIAITSFAAHFSRAERFCLNPHAGLRELTAHIPASRFAGEIVAIRASAGQGKVHNDSLREDASSRFLMKLALGVGDELFGPPFRATRMARQLRRGFWQQKPAVARFAAAPAGFALHGAWSLCLAVGQGQLGLAIVTPTGKALDIAFADDAALWRGPGHADLHSGMVFHAIPQRGIFTQGLPLDACQAHCAGVQPHPALAGLEALRVTPRQLPSKQGYA